MSRKFEDLYHILKGRSIKLEKLETARSRFRLK